MFQKQNIAQRIHTQSQDKITNAETIMQLWKLRACEVTNAINRHNRTKIQMQKLTHM